MRVYSRTSYGVKDYMIKDGWVVGFQIKDNEYNSRGMLRYKGMVQFYTPYYALRLV